MVLFDRYVGRELAILVHIFLSNEKNTEAIIEFKSLVISARINPVQIITGNRKSPKAKYFVGKGKAEEIAAAVKISNASMVLFDHTLSPAQERNLELLCQCRVIDFTSLILNIFTQRARNYEAQLQVELAKLRYLSTRLVRSWTHLERQKGGIGQRGPGETQLETDRRLIRNKIKQILFKLTKFEKQREQGRQFRNKADIPTISLVGYTNSGKSSLFKQITKSEVYIADQLFATLSPTLRRIDIDNIGVIVLVDTVGFIRRLPHYLVNSFKTTLQETCKACLLLHVVDTIDNRMEENIQVVKNVLKEIKANEITELLIMNKIDKLNGFIPRIDRNENNIPIRVWLSAKTGAGISLLLQALKELLSSHMVYYELHLPPEAGRLRSIFYQLQAIKDEKIYKDGSIMLVVKLPIIDWNKLYKQEQNLVKYIIN